MRGLLLVVFRLSVLCGVDCWLCVVVAIVGGVCCSLSRVVRCLLCVAYCVLFVVCCFVVCCSLRCVVLLFVV